MTTSVLPPPSAPSMASAVSDLSQPQTASTDTNRRLFFHLGRPCDTPSPSALSRLASKVQVANTWPIEFFAPLIMQMGWIKGVASCLYG
ncbi:uncharacterized protein YALI1_F24486g [Yarrowia lipolytica]|uniref:Uncharacterized protein n=1 Tax=Yarrowia lipolytica TaxID=4952 RepID=A0A1D8NP04_YARLL|nr:hypothetical protein YALI1_F24486g [Yarrowia lipolytica]